MQALLLLICVFLQHICHSLGACPPSPLSKEMINIWDELSALSRDLDDEINLRSQPEGYLSVVLRGGTLWNGKVSIYDEGRYKAVCDWNWRKSEADVVCRSLGLGKTAHFSTTDIGQEVYPVKFECEGWERTLGECHMTNKRGKLCENGVRVSCDNTGSGIRETRKTCQCDCQMMGAAGSPGMPGYPGRRGPKGSIGLPGWKGEPGNRLIAPISPSPYDDEEFVNLVKLRWKGFRGSWGRPGPQGGPGDQTECQCSAQAGMCEDWCGPQKGEKGLPGLPGLDGIPGVPGDKGETWYEKR